MQNPEEINEKHKRQIQNTNRKTNFGDLKLWIIQDDDYSDLRKADGCEQFSDL